MVDARIADAGGTVTVNRPPPAAVILPIRGMVAVLAVVLLVLHRLRRLFRRPVEGRPFVDENTRSGVSSARLSSDEISFHAAFAPRLPVVFAGLALLIVAEIFRRHDDDARESRGS